MPSSPAVRVMCAGNGSKFEKLIVSAPEPAVQLEPEGVASLLAESIACRSVHWLEVPAGWAVEGTLIWAALAPAASSSEAAIAPTIAQIKFRCPLPPLPLAWIPLPSVLPQSGRGRA